MRKHILFSFRRCPFAIRARWAIKMCELEVEIREIDLKNKPVELINNSDSKTVPLLILNNGDVIEESLDIIFWALKNSQNNDIEKYFKKSYQEIILKTIHENDLIFKYHLDRFKYASRFNPNEKEFHFKKAQRFLEKYNISLSKSNKNRWLIGNQESIADWCIWPFVRQFKIACDSQGILDYFEEPMECWFNYFSKHKNLKFVMHKYSVWESSAIIETYPKNLDF
tara:strand:+ start:209 stop:883 length:675 start_codon:yes stop_codon:yes gene_type:complete